MSQKEIYIFYRLSVSFQVSAFKIMRDEIEAQFGPSVSHFESTSAVFAHIDGNRCCRTLNVKLVRNGQFENRIFKFHRFENLKPMYESLELASSTFDHDHLQIYWNNKDNAWQIINAGLYSFNNNDPSKDKFSLRIDRQRGEDPQNSQD